MFDEYALGLVVFIMLICFILFLLGNEPSLPNSGLAFLILEQLKEGELSGYELMKAIEKKYPELLHIKFKGQMFPTLHMLEEYGRIEANWLRLPGKLRSSRVYRLKRQ